MRIINWEDKLIDLIELELEKCPQKKGECYMNDILGYVRELLETHDMKKETITNKIGEAFGEVSALFMSQECKGTEIIMPTEDLVKIQNWLVEEIYE